MSVNAKAVTKPAFNVTDEKVEVADEMIYVSRAAHKLKGFLPSLPFTPKGLEALDIGASTGGFTQVLLEEGVKSVTCVDVGRGQLHQKLLDDKRVTSFENMDIRDYPRQKQYDLVTSDVSFISLHHILESVDGLSKKWIILLFKPQFEVGKDVKRDSNGVVTDDKAIAAAAQAGFGVPGLGLVWATEVLRNLPDKRRSEVVAALDDESQLPPGGESGPGALHLLNRLSAFF